MLLDTMVCSCMFAEKLFEDEILVDVARRFGLAGRADVARVIRGLPPVAVIRCTSSAKWGGPRQRVGTTILEHTHTRNIP